MTLISTQLYTKQRSSTRCKHRHGTLGMRPCLGVTFFLKIISCTCMSSSYGIIVDIMTITGTCFEFLRCFKRTNDEFCILFIRTFSNPFFARLHEYELQLRISQKWLVEFALVLNNAVSGGSKCLRMETWRNRHCDSRKHAIRRERFELLAKVSHLIWVGIGRE